MALFKPVSFITNSCFAALKQKEWIMDKISSPYAKEFLSLRSEPMQKLAQKLAIATDRLALAHNCCEVCGGAWRAWDGMVANMMTGFEPGVHPVEVVLDEMSRIDTLAKTFMTQKEEKILAGNSLPGKDKKLDYFFEYLLTNLKDKKPQDYSNMERASVHLLAKHEMMFPLKEFLNDKVRLASTARNRDYHWELTGLYPYRQPDGTGLRITSIDLTSLEASSVSPSPKKQVKLFIDSTLHPLERLKLYQHIAVERFQIDDLEYYEENLNGQWRVIARQSIAKGACVGILAGTLVPEDVITRTDYFDPELVINISVSKKSVAYLDRDGVMSKLNTRPVYSNFNINTGQQEDGCNVKAEKFKAQLADKRVVYVIAIFALKDIYVGEELRGNLT